MGEPATEMELKDSAKASRGLDLGLKNAMASDLDGLRWRSLFRSQLWTLWVQDCIEATWCTSVDALVPIYSWVSLMKGHQVGWFWQVGIYYIGNRWYEKHKKKWAKDRSLGHTCGYCCGGWGWWVNFDKGWAICKVGANPRHDKAWQTKSMLKSVKKCSVIKSIECCRHVESS